MKRKDVDITKLKLISYERTLEDAREVAKYHKLETGKQCLITNPTGQRARKGTYDKPWQVRELGD